MMWRERPVLATVAAVLDGTRPSHHVRVKVIEAFGSPPGFTELRLLEPDKFGLVRHPAVNLGEMHLFFVQHDNVVHPCGVREPEMKLMRAIGKARQDARAGAYPGTLAKAPAACQRRFICASYVLVDCMSEFDGPLLVYHRYSGRVLGDCGFWPRHSRLNESLCKSVDRQSCREMPAS